MPLRAVRAPLAYIARATRSPHAERRSHAARGDVSHRAAPDASRALAARFARLPAATSLRLWGEARSVKYFLVSFTDLFGVQRSKLARSVRRSRRVNHRM